MGLLGLSRPYRPRSPRKAAFHDVPNTFDDMPYASWSHPYGYPKGPSFDREARLRYPSSYYHDVPLGFPSHVRGGIYEYGGYSSVDERKFGPRPGHGHGIQRDHGRLRDHDRYPHHDKHRDHSQRRGHSRHRDHGKSRASPDRWYDDRTDGRRRHAGRSTGYGSDYDGDYGYDTVDDFDDGFAGPSRHRSRGRRFPEDDFAEYPRAGSRHRGSFYGSDFGEDSLGEEPYSTRRGKHRHGGGRRRRKHRGTDFMDDDFGEDGIGARPRRHGHRGANHGGGSYYGSDLGDDSFGNNGFSDDGFGGRGFGDGGFGTDGFEDDDSGQDPFAEGPFRPRPRHPRHHAGRPGPPGGGGPNAGPGEPSEPEDTRTPWEVLGIAPGASREEIMSAFKKRRVETHPDKHTEEIAKDPAAKKNWEAEFHAVTKAKETLINPPNPEQMRQPPPRGYRY